MKHIQEKIILMFSRKPDTSDYIKAGKEWTVDNALDLLIYEYPNFAEIVGGKRVADFGCGNGYQSIALARKFNCLVTGIESNRNTLKKAIALAECYDLYGTEVSFVGDISPDMLNSFDVVISQNSFEHFKEPEVILGKMKSLLNDTGRLLITFGPPWFAPYGSHMQYFCKIPWINILFSEAAVMRSRSQYRNDGAIRYQDVESGLNKMTVSKFEKIISSNDMIRDFCKYRCVKNADFLAGIPIIRELFINHISVGLTRR
jgi:SAM-dependent methyltransferase